ncbi:tape measure protein [Rubrivivax albus]|uniref:Tape measure protein N-terminal domain-containing protein n=1 Tax=Rubrivivax albus TaxID=2499835 RepID=A0A3S2U709_9BURK|nr:tape measure protein [Rubrivivax albus]RVT49656.1 hypothetical protein ENE75_18595 [Rubrivivax albus]
MATRNRDVRLGVAIETTGEESLDKLADDLRDLGKAGDLTAEELQSLTTEVQQLAAATKARRDAEATARADERAARDALAARREELARLRAETDRAGRQTVEFQTAERALKVAIVDATTAVRQATATRQTANNATRAAITAESELAATIRRSAEASRAGIATQTAAGATFRGELDKIGVALRNVQALAGVAIGGTLLTSAARDVGETADAYANLAARVKLATGEGADFQATFAELFQIAQRTGVAIDDVGALFTKLSQAGRELKLSTADALGLTETITQALQLSGASAQEAASGVQQFAQALASGRLQGDELRSILENAPRLARALSEGLGVTVGQLRELGAQGTLTADRVIAALQGQSAALQSEFDRLPPTVGRALANLSTAWTQYIGESDAATGASAAAAAAINALAANLDTLGTLLYSAGKAAAAYQALKLAQTFLGIATATKAATVETVAYTAAQTAATTATAGTAAAASRFAAIVGGLKLAALVGVVTNLREIGTWIGESVAQLVGYRDRTAEIEEEQRAAERSAAAWAQQTAALAAEQRRASEAAAGLTVESRRLVGEFEQARTKGDSVAAALDKVRKALDLSDARGISDAITALDVLRERGEITGEALTQALAGALNGRDLGVFAATARAVFDDTEQGARRLGAALEAVVGESLRRAGTSARELQTGFSEAAASAINDVDSLADALDTLGADAGTAGRLLADALDRATDAAGTERAVQAVIDRVEALGEAGKLTGEALADALTTARAKLDELRPGVDSLAEALAAFGIKTRTELQATADKLGAAYRQIAQAVDVSLTDKIRAFNAYRDAAIAANGGVESSDVALQRKILETQAAAAGLGDVIESSMRRARKATDEATAAVNRYGERLNQTAGSLGGSVDGLRGPGDPLTTPSIRDTPASAGGSFQPAKPPGDGWTFVPDQRAFGGVSPADAVAGRYPIAPTTTRVAVNGVGYWVRSQADANASSTKAGATTYDSPFGGYAGSSQQRADQAAARTIRLELAMPSGRTVPATVAESDAAGLMRELELARGTGG